MSIRQGETLPWGRVRLSERESEPRRVARTRTGDRPETWKKADIREGASRLLCPMILEKRKG